MELDPKVSAKLASLIGVKDDEITLTSALTENIHKLISTFY
jgi:kynureninase